MRALETILIILLSIQLIVLIFGFFIKSHYRKYLIFLSVAILAGHLVFEGYRWQMIPAYCLLLFLSIIILILMKGKSWKIIRVTRNLGLLLLLALAIILPLTLPVLKFSNDNGNFKVGVKKNHIIDKSRAEVLTKDSNDFRELSLRIFYPTSEENTKYTPYIPDFDKIKHSYEKKLGWPPFLLEYLKYFKIEAIEDAEMINTEKLPLIIYSHGLTNNYTEAGGRMMKLAARGYIVVAINHTYSSDYAILSGGEVVGYKALSQLGDPVTKVDSVKTIIANQWVEDVETVIENLKKSKNSQTIDFENIGLIGFSAGGTMATLGSYKLDNIKAAINLDGTPRGIDFDEKPKCPQLFMFSEPEQFSNAQIKAWGITREMIDAPLRLINDRSKEILAVAPSHSYIARIPNTKHSNFIEYALISPFSDLLDIGGEINSWDCYEMINEMIFAFLDKNLKGNPVEFP